MLKDGGNLQAHISILTATMAIMKVLEEVKGMSHDNPCTFKIKKMKKIREPILHQLPLVLPLVENPNLIM